MSGSDDAAPSHAAPEQADANPTLCSEFVLEAVKRKGKQQVSKSATKARKRLIAQLEAEVDTLEQVDEHGVEIEANYVRRGEILSQLEVLGAS